MGVVSEWYSSLQKAPWTPPGWVFGAAWTSIMVCFAIYMGLALGILEKAKKLLVLYLIQWLLNVLWNPIFFYFQQIDLAMFVIITLTFLVNFIFIKNMKTMNWKSLLIIPYCLWMFIASSLNIYIWINN
jgi:tryptophan-rich sensory protein